MANRPEIKVYPVEFNPSPQASPHDQGTPTRENHPPRGTNWPERQRRTADIDRYLQGLTGKHVTVHTSSSTEGPSSRPGTARAGIFRGILEAVLSEAIVIRSEHGQVLIYDWAIVAIESQ